ncbi:hypothetical protein [Methanosarcina mazei]|uniref:Uncharacterized protein n=7 Tax=Methanosarcina mazei TaxID=2209 RepID=A0A0F8E9F7_METMZ|nr:hypothetical protein [Methanosarcina mazei]AAM29781.1 conserved protein [Methanosarcina mazei Go1]AGF95551.1 hypothetical protein MmTuc01_0094 [Methanosarcina mazei Tuc01]AKB40209.1 hypothetical protein MSMAW_1218 [Methanosarcina mazei WWM610]AKB61129.1 hypothetical protein MSMAP_1144 [Methanosarcina mazei SarPi]AKB64441.1 hypothetical protein MSMAS_1245 [Methanosarcina mazei S-6]AKB67772.1 hypothetical protein MSMAL_1229 [Methanosarcina mazei LYC]UWJ22713.1 hypothetical protein MSMAT_145
MLLFVVLALFFHFYKIRLLSHSLRLCNWICGMAISSDSPWVKMFVLHLVFFIRFLMYLAIISLEQVDKLTTRSLFRHYISGSRIVLLEYMSAFTHSSSEIEKNIYSRNFQAAGRTEQFIKK